MANFQAHAAVTGAQQLEEMAGRNDLPEMDSALADFERAAAELIEGLKGLRV